MILIVYIYFFTFVIILMENIFALYMYVIDVESHYVNSFWEC